MVNPKKLVLIFLQYAWSNCLYNPHQDVKQLIDFDHLTALTHHEIGSSTENYLDQTVNHNIPFDYYLPLDSEHLGHPIVQQSGILPENHLHQTTSHDGLFHGSASAPYDPLDASQSHQDPLRQSYDLSNSYNPTGTYDSASYYSHTYPQFHHYSQGQSYGLSYSLHNLYNFPRQNLPHNPPQVGLNDFEAQIHPSSSHVQSQSQWPSIHESRDPEIDTQAFYGTKQNINSFDFLKHLLPYYLMAASKYPYLMKRSSANFKDLLISTIKKAIGQSHYKITLSEKQVESLIKFTKPPRDVKGFLVSLCLKNIAFLRCIHKPFDHQILAEITETLNWLHDILRLTSNLNDDHTAKIVLYHLQVVQKEPSTSSRRIPKISISECEAKEAQVILIVLGNYYKSKNPDTWQKIFDEDQSFLKFYVRLGTKQINNMRKVPESHWKKLNGEDGHIDLLPWSEDKTQEISISGTLFDNKTKQFGTLLKTHVNQNDDEYLLLHGLNI